MFVLLETRGQPLSELLLLVWLKGSDSRNNISMDFGRDREIRRAGLGVMPASTMTIWCCVKAFLPCSKGLLLDGEAALIKCWKFKVVMEVTR